MKLKDLKLGQTVIISDMPEWMLKKVKNPETGRIVQVRSLPPDKRWRYRPKHLDYPHELAKDIGLEHKKHTRQETHVHEPMQNIHKKMTDNGWQHHRTEEREGKNYHYYKKDGKTVEFQAPAHQKI